MNPLTEYIRAKELDETQTLNLLQEHGIISDLCVWADDVAYSDAKRATGWLELRAMRGQLETHPCSTSPST